MEEKSTVLRICIYCREKVPPDANFCCYCGARMPYVPKPELEKVEIIKSAPKEKGEPPTVFTADELAKYLKTSKCSIYELAKKGDLGHVRIGSRYLFPKQAVDDWLEKGCTRKQTS